MSRRASLTFIAFLVVVFVASPACRKGGAAVKRYPVKGKVTEVDLGQKLLTLDHQDIPGYMPAMIMPFPVKDDQLLKVAAPGDEVTASLVITRDNRYWLEDLVVTRKTPEGARPSARPAHREPEPGEAVAKALAAEPALQAQTHLLSISFDPEHDTPEVLKRYGRAFAGEGPRPFAHWEFAPDPTRRSGGWAASWASTTTPTRGCGCTTCAPRWSAPTVRSSGPSAEATGSRSSSWRTCAPRPAPRSGRRVFDPSGPSSRTSRSAPPSPARAPPSPFPPPSSWPGRGRGGRRPGRRACGSSGGGRWEGRARRSRCASSRSFPRVSPPAGPRLALPGRAGSPREEGCRAPSAPRSCAAHAGRVRRGRRRSGPGSSSRRAVPSTRGVETRRSPRT